MPAFLDASKAHLESGLYFDPPHERCFRIDQSKLAEALCKRFGVQEMDFGWWDESQRIMYLLEVKDYAQAGASFSADHYLNECIQKATDCLLLLASIWYGLPYGSDVKLSLPEEWHARPAAPPRLHLYFVIKTPEASKDMLGMDALQAKARDKIKGRLELLQVRSATTLFLLDHRAAAKLGLPIKTEDEITGAPSRGRLARRRGR